MPLKRFRTRHALIAALAAVGVTWLGTRIFVAPTGHEGLLIHGGFLVCVGVLLVEVLFFMVYLFDPHAPDQSRTARRVPDNRRGD